MNRVIVVSDSHGLVKPLEDIYEHFKDSVQLFIHCGDSELSLDHPLVHIYETVKGNVDSSQFPFEKQFEIGGRRILVTHGHKQWVRMGLGRLIEFGRNKQADIVCYGHTHKPLYREEDG